MTDPTLPADLRNWLSGPGKGWEATEPGSLVVRALARVEALEGALGSLESAVQAHRFARQYNSGSASAAMEIMHSNNGVTLALERARRALTGDSK